MQSNESLPFPCQNPQLSSLKCRSIITRAFSPYVSVYASSDTEALARDLGFDSFCSLLRPFGDKIAGSVSIRDSQGVSNTYDDFSIHFSNPPGQQKSSAPVSPPKAVSKSPASVSQGSGNTLKSGFIASHNRGRSIDSIFPRNINQSMALYNNDTLEQHISQSLSTTSSHTDVYTDFFQKLVTQIPVTPFESFGHPVASVIAISSRNETPIEELSSLYKASNESIPEYVNRDYLRYYVLVHDEQTELNKSVALFEKMKRNFGIHCHMVRIQRQITEDTRTETIPLSEWITYDEYFNDLTTQPDRISLHEADVQSLRDMTRELVVQSIIPFMERCSTTWNDQIASSRRGITGRLFSASRKYFSSKGSLFSSGSTSTSTSQQTSPFQFPFSSSSSPTTTTASTSNTSYNTTKSYYGYNSPEALLRKLGDFAFMLRDYGFAYSTYELLKGDFHNSKAWSYLAASQDISAVSYLMSQEGKNLTIKSRLDIVESLLDSSTYSYISRCSMPSYALRGILLTSELMCLTTSPSAVSDGATRWLLKAVNENLTGPLGKALLLERISNAYSIYDSIVYTKPAVSANTGNDNKSVESNEILTARKNKGTRHRKAAFWMLLASRQWTALSEVGSTTGILAHSSITDATKCIEVAGKVYDDLEWTMRSDGLLAVLLSVLEKKDNKLRNEMSKLDLHDKETPDTGSEKVPHMITTTYD